MTERHARTPAQPLAGPVEIDWGHLLLLAAIGGWILVFLLDTRSTSLSIHNLLLVQPTAIIGLLLCLAVLPQCFRRRAVSVGTEEEALAKRRRERAELANIALLAAALGAFVSSLETVGFDVACWLFTAVATYICGERRWWVNLSFTTVLTLVLIYGYRAMIPFPFPLTVL
ncbi:MAG TPA: tripartite tricarboxylate transporter TctB family protein [Hyphomicrobiaceae bacterium]|nr:tripartite tricarboxylate transporter TctB family protein [Hyphomicrobiaceae bacterium]